MTTLALKIARTWPGRVILIIVWDYAKR